MILKKAAQSLLALLVVSSLIYVYKEGEKAVKNDVRFNKQFRVVGGSFKKLGPLIPFKKEISFEKKYHQYLMKSGFAGVKTNIRDSMLVAANDKKYTNINWER